MKALEVILLLAALAMILVSAYLIFDIFPSRENFNVERRFSQSLPEINASGEQFYPNMRYPKREIYYSVEEACSLEKRKNIVEAFSILSRATILRFYESKENAEIEIMCSEIPSNISSDSSHFIAGEGGPTKIINATRYSVITQGKVSLYRDEKCNSPNIALHEILHALGFDHNNDPESILYPVTNCEKEIDSYVIDRINALYSQDSAPDMAVESVTASASGRYLAFNITIANYGLETSKTGMLNIYSNGEIIRYLELDPLEIGRKRIISVSNLKMPRDADKLEFEIDLGSSQRDFDEENNKAVLSLTGSNL